MARKVASKRYDSNHIVLHTGEYQRKDGLYLFKYTDTLGKPRQVASKTLTDLREKEKEIKQDLQDGIKTRIERDITVNAMFDMYIQTKTELKESTKSNYIYMYNNYVRDSFGLMKLADVKYSKVKAFYVSLIKEKGFKPNSMEIIHTILHPTFTLAVRDNYIRTNPTDGVMAEIKKSHDWEKPKRHALTEEQQGAFIDYMKTSEIYNHWLPMFTCFLGTGCRVGELIGLTWKDCDFENNSISINHNLIYRQRETGDCGFSVTTPKTESGKRTIPMLPEVRNALITERKRQFAMGGCKVEIDGYKGFVFTNRFGMIHNPMTINRAIVRIYSAYNKEEKAKAKEEHREPVLIPHFSVHNLRHTFCTRFCENETNVKVIQEIMGHSDISTTMNIYAEATEKKKQEVFKNLEGKIKIC